MKEEGGSGKYIFMAGGEGGEGGGGGRGEMGIEAALPLPLRKKQGEVAIARCVRGKECGREGRGVGGGGSRRVKHASTDVCVCVAVLVGGRGAS